MSARIHSRGGKESEREKAVHNKHVRDLLARHLFANPYSFEIAGFCGGPDAIKARWSLVIALLLVFETRARSGNGRFSCRCRGLPFTSAELIGDATASRNHHRCAHGCCPHGLMVELPLKKVMFDV